MQKYETLKEEKFRERNTLKENEKIKEDVKSKKILPEDKIIVGNYSEAPDYLKDNEYIKNGYLINCTSMKLVLRSLFVCSNETINVWSHLIGCIISIILIILTANFIKTGKIKELTQTEYEKIKIRVNEVVKPLINHLNEKNEESNEINNINISYMLNKMKTNSETLIGNFGSKSTAINNIENFVEINDNIINQIMEKSNNTNIINMIIQKWEVCSNKITNYINKYIENDIKGENISRWPLFVMLSAAIICFGFSTSFHWFSIYSKELYSLLCRLDYAGITFLIPGSCYPPYYYFYYCEKCK
jgi:adiponectin receptor